jgi:hypothetical protein
MAGAPWLPSPKLFLILGLVYNILMVPLGLVKNLGTFTAIQMFIKILPILTLWNVPIQLCDISKSFLILFVYIIHVTVFRHQKLFETRAPLTNLLIKNKLITE